MSFPKNPPKSFSFYNNVKISRQCDSNYWVEKNRKGSVFKKNSNYFHFLAKHFDVHMCQRYKKL